MNAVVISIATVACFICSVGGHGRMLDPPNRSSMWRYGFNNPPNWSDNQLFCGGMGVQYQQNGGKCGICGDNYADETPRQNENGGFYGQGIIVKSYEKGGQVPVFVELTQEHKGYFEFGLCNLDVERFETEECFQSVLLVGGADKYPVTGLSQYVNHTLTLQLPNQAQCDHCVLRWHYRTGNNQGLCEDGTTALGCGDQEIFRGCADITIL